MQICASDHFSDRATRFADTFRLPRTRECPVDLEEGISNFDALGCVPRDFEIAPPDFIYEYRKRPGQYLIESIAADGLFLEQFVASINPGTLAEATIASINDSRVMPSSFGLAETFCPVRKFVYRT